MPKIFEYFGFIFYFYSNEHEPIHVHVLHGDKESVFDLGLDIPNRTITCWCDRVTPCLSLCEVRAALDVK